MKRARLAVKLEIDIESDIEDEELLEIHAAEAVRRALSREIDLSFNMRFSSKETGAKESTSIRLVGIFEGVDARLVRDRPE